MPENSSFKIRPMTGNDLAHALRLSNEEGWNQTEKDWKLLLENRDNICIVAELNNKVAGTATALNHSNKVAWIGMVLVDKTLRGHGAGKMLLSHIIDRLDHIQSIKLDATPAGQPLYRSLGFAEEHNIIRMTTASLDYSYFKNFPGEPVVADQKKFSSILKLDYSIFGADRRYLLERLFQNNPGKTFFIERDSKPEGYMFYRDGARFNYIGPVNALSSESARTLISIALKSLNNQPIALDILEDKKDLIEWLESVGFMKQRQFARMYLKSNPYPGIVNYQYLISGPEFG